MSKSDKWPPDWWLGGKMSKSGQAAAGTAAGITLGGMIGTAIKNIKNRRETLKEEIYLYVFQKGVWEREITLFLSKIF